MSESINGAAATAPQLPPLYRSLEAVTPERHGKLRLRDAGLGFARTLSAVPITAEEIPVAARTLAIVFAAQAPHLPVALTSLVPEKNNFIDAGGAWKIGAYVPAYLRRYPFFLLRVAEASQDLALCVDPSAPQLGTEQGEPMFTEDGKLAPQLERAFAFTRSVEEAMLRTRTMTTRLAELGLLKPAQVQFERLGKPLRIDGFFAVDRPSLAALPADQLVELRDRGWMEVIYAHMVSLGGLPELAAALPPA
ncbi:SapC family protein [Siccirubricoccus phaeus]|uniref:SapC family protein n=1 Tax=Siccirubricoccus phaeus TaxID=2595053 RepID=UPI00165C7D5C|nr:SapC family protein [Siccirubricoccus phaeus]